MKFRCLGVRGSVPTIPEIDDIQRDLLVIEGGRHDFAKFMSSENTSCYEIVSGEDNLFIDMGTGIINRGKEDASDASDVSGASPANAGVYNIFLTHFHWDHLEGLPFFGPLKRSGATIHFYSTMENAKELLDKLLDERHSGIPASEIKADLKFTKLERYKKVSIGNLEVTPFRLDHPNETSGYRVDSPEGSITIGCDSEFIRTAPEDLGEDRFAYAGTDILLFDAQYLLKDLMIKKGWGHSSFPIGVELAVREGVKQLVLTHHEPTYTMEQLNGIEQGARAYAVEYARQKGYPDTTVPEIISAYEGLEIELDNSGKGEAMRDVIAEYRGEIISRLEKIALEEREGITALSQKIYDSMISGGVWHIFGTGHSHMLAEEAFHRAGGLVPVNPVIEEILMPGASPGRSGPMERLTGVADILFEYYDIRKSEVLMVVSNSGINSTSVEMALRAKKEGVFVAAITSLQHSRSVKSRHTSGRKLYEIADLVLDNKGEGGDALLSWDLSGDKLRGCPGSTAAGIFMINLIVAGVIESYVESGVKPPVYISANLPGGDEHNKGLEQKYRNRIKRL